MTPTVIYPLETRPHIVVYGGSQRFPGFCLGNNLNFAILCGKKSGVEEHCLNFTVIVHSDFE